MEDGGGWQLVELREAASWRFLWFSGTLKVCCSGWEPTGTNSKSTSNHFFQLIECTCRPSVDVLRNVPCKLAKSPLLRYKVLSRFLCISKSTTGLQGRDSWRSWRNRGTWDLVIHWSDSRAVVCFLSFLCWILAISCCLQVTVPKRNLCQVNSGFMLGNAPDMVYNILIDPANKRVLQERWGLLNHGGSIFGWYFSNLSDCSLGVMMPEELTEGRIFLTIIPILGSNVRYF